MAVMSSLYNKIDIKVKVSLEQHLVINIIRCFFIICIVFTSALFSHKAYSETAYNRFKELNGRKILSNHPEQEYYLYIPDSFTGKELWPLFIGIHPYTGNGAGAQEMWKRFAPWYRFILVCPTFPNGFQWLKHNTAERMIDIIKEVQSC